MEDARGRKDKVRLDEIKSLYRLGKITYDHAKELALEPLRILNEEMSKMAREFGRRHKMVAFAGFMR